MSDQPEIDTARPEAVSDGTFTSIGDIRIAHLDLMRQASESEALAEATKRAPDGPSDDLRPKTESIRAFLGKTQQAGATIGRESDRRAAQRILDYWSAELVSRPGITKADISPIRLVSFEGAVRASIGDSTEIPAATTDGPAEPAVDSLDVALTEDEKRERLRLRVAAQARQWETTRYDGYLLRGDALKEAAKLPHGRDIDAFIQASIGLRDRSKNWLVSILVIVALLFAGLAFYALVQAREATSQADEATKARLLAEAKTAEILGLDADLKAQVAATEAALADAKGKAGQIMALNDQLLAQVGDTRSALDAALKAGAEARAAEAQAKAALELANQKADDSTKRANALESTQAALDSAIRLIVVALAQGEIPLASVDDQLRSLALVQVAGEVKNGGLIFDFLPSAVQDALAPLIDNVPNVLPADLPGYDPDFIGAEIPLPTLNDDLAADAPDEPADYVNYSLLMSNSHRMAYYAAANLDRSQRLVLQMAGGRFDRDTRMADDIQPDPAWYGADWVPVQLASAGDIAWGPAFAGSPGVNALKLSLYANVLPNSMPQPPALAAGIWAQLENWVRNQHNPLANRITILTGPIFAPIAAETAPANAVPVPTAYWKIAVSSVSNAVKGASLDPEFVVDAFLIPRDTTETKFYPSTFRISIAELERLTGIDFGDLIEWTDSINHPAPDGTTLMDDLAARVGLLDSQHDTERQSTRGELLAALGSSSLPAAERRKVVAALVKMAGAASMQTLSGTGRLNVLQALLWVPGELWRRPDWLTLWSAARVAVGDLEVRQQSGDTVIVGQTRDLLNRLEPQLGIKASAQKVYLQFAGMTRGAAETLSARMRALGWGIPKPGEERTGAAAGKNEVRYNPDTDADRQAAERLAADLTAAGQIVVARPVSIIRPNILEIWISI